MASRESQKRKKNMGLGLHGKAQVVVDCVKLLWINETTFEKEKFKDINTYDLIYQNLKEEGKQWNIFVSLFAEILKFCNDSNSFEINKWDDPTTVVNQMILFLRDSGLDFKYNPQSLKQGYGPEVVTLLYELTKKLNLVIEKPTEEEEAVGSELEEILDDLSNSDTDIEEDINDDIHSSLSMSVTSDDDIKQLKLTEEKNDEVKMTEREKKEWKLSVEKLTPTIRKEMQKHRGIESVWRKHLDDTTLCTSNVSQVTVEVSKDLQILSKSVLDDLTKIKTQETILQADSKQISDEWLAVEVDFVDKKQMEVDLTSEVKELREQCAFYESKIIALKKETEERGKSLSDTKPLQDLKSALRSLKSEMSDMNLDIKVLQQRVITT